MSNEVFSIILTRNEDMQPLLKQIGSLEHFVLVSVRSPFFKSSVFKVSGISSNNRNAAIHKKRPRLENIGISAGNYCFNLYAMSETTPKKLFSTLENLLSGAIVSIC